MATSDTSLKTPRKACLGSAMRNMFLGEEENHKLFLATYIDESGPRMPASESSVWLRKVAECALSTESRGAPPLSSLNTIIKEVKDSPTREPAPHSHHQGAQSKPYGEHPSGSVSNTVQNIYCSRTLTAGVQRICTNGKFVKCTFSFFYTCRRTTSKKKISWKP